MKQRQANKLILQGSRANVKISTWRKAQTTCRWLREYIASLERNP